MLKSTCMLIASMLSACSKLQNIGLAKANEFVIILSNQCRIVGLVL